MIAPMLDVEKFLENLLLDEHREAYAMMSADQKTVVRFAYLRGWALCERAAKEELK